MAAIFRQSATYVCFSVEVAPLFQVVSTFSHILYDNLLYFDFTIMKLGYCQLTGSIKFLVIVFCIINAIFRDTSCQMLCSDIELLMLNFGGRES